MADAPRAHSASPAELKEQIEAERRGEPFLVYRDGDGAQQIIDLGAAERITVGRAAGAELVLDWDTEVSRVHAELERVGSDWTVADDGLSRNGTFVNGERIGSRRRLADGDVIRIGATHATYRSPEAGEGGAGSTAVAIGGPSDVKVSDAQRRVLVGLCRPFRDGSAYATPATNKEIAEELVLSVDAVKTHMRALFSKFEVEDLPQNQKRVRLAELALQTGVILPRDL